VILKVSGRLEKFAFITAEPNKTKKRKKRRERCTRREREREK